MIQKTIGLLVCVTLLLSGCGNAAASGQEEASAGQPPAAETVYGKIKEMNGNEMLLVLGSYQTGAPGGQAGMAGGNAASSPAGSSGESAVQSDTDRRRAADGEAGGTNRGEQAGANQSADGAAPLPPNAGGEVQEPQQGQSAEGATTGNRRQGGGMSGNRQGGGSFVSSGEEQDYLIPVTAAVTTGQGDRAREIRFTQLAVKNIVCLHLDEKGEIVSMEVLE